jgi:uncharacterized protein involved in exopolysaccharide biosynthesis/Mrp family chromosome partitioning ATPase
MTTLVSTARRRGASAEPAAAPAAQRRSDGAVEIAELWRILWHRRLLILAIAGLFALAALLYGLLTPSLYTASSQILIDPRDRNVVSNDVNPSAVSPDGGIAQVESQASVVQSTGVLVRAIRAARLTEDEEFVPRGFLSGLFGFARSQPPASADGLSPAEAEALANLRRKMSVRRADKVLVVDVVVTTREAEKSATLANGIAEAYLADQAEARSRAARAASEGLSARLAEQRKRVEAAENAVERYRADNNLVAASGRLITDQQLAEISNQHSAAQARTAALRAQVEQLSQQRREGGLAGNTAEAMQSAVIAKLREQEAVLVQREAEMQAQLGPRHPQFVATRSQLERTRQLITTEIQRVEQALRRDYDRAVGNERLLASKLEALTRQTQGSDQASVRLRDLQRDLEAARSVYASFLLRAQETREQANLDSTNARVISRALPPLRKSWPPLALLVLGAASIGLGLGAGAALVREYAAPHLFSLTQAEASTGVPVIGVFGRGPRQADAGAPVTAPPAVAPQGRDLNSAGLALLRLSEEPPSRPSLQSIVLVSTAADAAERKRAAQLLAEAAAVRGEEVLLVDADVTRGEAGEGRGLLSVLRTECSLESALRVRADSDIGLLPLGGAEARPQGIGRAAAARLLADAARHFDVVIIDGGAPGQNLGMAALFGAAEHVVLVTRLYETRQSEIAAVSEAVGVLGRSLSATILVDPRQG